MSLVALKQPYLLQVMYDTEPLNPREDYDNFGHMMCWHRRYNLGDENRFETPNDFLMNLVRRTASEYAIIRHARFGKSDTIRLSYDKSAHGWSIECYDSYSKKWYQEDFVEGRLEDKTREVADYLVEAMSNNDLLKIASVENVILPLNLYDHSGLRMSADSFTGRAQHAEWDSGQVGWIYATASEIRAEYGSVSAENVEKARQRLLSEVQDYDYFLSGQCFGYRLYEDGEETDSCWGFLGHLEDVLKEIAGEVLPESHRDMVDELHEMSDTKTIYKGYEDFVEEMEALAR